MYKRQIDIGPYEYSASTAVAPLPVTELTATDLSSTSIRLDWVNRCDLETGFQVERLSDETVGWEIVGYASAGVSTYTDEDLTPSTTYTYRVLPYNAVGLGGRSNHAQATT